MSPHDHTRDDTGDALARAARDAHAASLDHLSPRVQAQLAQRRRAATQSRRSAARGWPMLATASTAALALAIGVFVLRDDGAPPSQVADAPATTPATVAPRLADAASPLPDTLIAAEFGAADAAGYGTFDEAPDFYAWLGSQDALADITESL